MHGLKLGILVPALALLSAPAARATDVLALANRSEAAWSLVLLAPKAGEQSQGTITVECKGKAVQTLARTGDTLAMAKGFKGLLVFNKAAGAFSQRFSLVDRTKQYQQFHAYIDPNRNNAIHATVGANSRINVFSTRFMQELNAYISYDSDQYYLVINEDAWPAR